MYNYITTTATTTTTTTTTNNNNNNNNNNVAKQWMPVDFMVYVAEGAATDE